MHFIPLIQTRLNNLLLLNLLLARIIIIIQDFIGIVIQNCILMFMLKESLDAKDLGGFQKAG